MNMRIISYSGFLFDIKYYKIYQIWQPWKSKYYFSKKIIQNLSFTLKFAWYLLKHGKLFFTHDDLAIHLFMKPSLDFLKIGVI